MQINGDCSSCCNGTRANAPGAQHSLGEFIDFWRLNSWKFFPPNVGEVIKEDSQVFWEEIIDWI